MHQQGSKAVSPRQNAAITRRRRTVENEEVAS
jgi:hypothetical protein